MTSRSEVFEAAEQDAGVRLDKWLTDCLQEADYEVSRSHVQQWIAAGLVTGSRPRLKASDILNIGDVYTVHVPDPEPVEIPPDEMDLDIVYEDAQVVVVNKPRGLVVHPAAGHARGTLVNGLVARHCVLSQLGGAARPGVVHRIDKDTSGLLVLAKTDMAYHRLTDQLRSHSMQRVYLAIVHGRVTHDQGTIEAPVGRDPKNRQRMAVTASGKDAVTHFHVLERFAEFTFVALKLETGRTHQIRVHMAYIGHPLAGDPVYGPRRTLDIKGQALHAAELGFLHPNGEDEMSFQAPVPDDMERILEALRFTTV